MILEQRYYKKRPKHVLASKIINATVSEVLELARKYLIKDTRNIDLLDVGCGSGEYAFKFEKFVKKVVGVEPYIPIYEKAIKQRARYKSSVILINKKIEAYQTNQRFDVVVSQNTIEHMPNAKKSFEKIFELMRPGAILYLTAPNKLWPIEQHYHLPFLALLPLKWANVYMRITGKGDSYEDCSYSLSYCGIRKFFDQFPCEYHFVVPKSIDVGYLGCGEGGIWYKFMLSVGIRLIRFNSFFWNFSKGFILVAVKK